MIENELHDIHKNNSEVFESASDSSVNEIEEENNQVNDRFKKVEGIMQFLLPTLGTTCPQELNCPLNESTASKSSKDNLEQPKDVRPSALLIEEKSVIEQHTNRQAENLRKSQSPRVDKRNWNGLMTQKLGDGFEFNKKACFVCGSLNHLIKDSNFYKNKMVGKSMLNNMGRVTVLTKSSNVPVNTAKQSSSRAAVSNSTARYVNTAATRPTVNDAKPCSNVFHKSHSSVKRTIYQRTAPKNSVFKEKVNIAKVNNVTTVGIKAVVSAIQGHEEKAGNPQYALQDQQGIFNSGCSRHMTMNKSYLTDYQDIDGGFVAFDESPKGGKITGKGKIKTGKLDFKDVYFVKELKFSLFSVSKMCDKKNSVLFTETECLILSPDFKLLDESQVLLKVHRQNNMYSFNLKNVVPLGEGKAAQSLLCDNGTEFKNSELNQFCEMKGIKREFSVAMTLQQNRNRVLITKPHNKTPYELLIGRSPNLDFMRPFGCPVTILNTLEHLGKFEGKADEGFLVGYSVNRSGPEWLFDIDSLTKSMNYKPVTYCSVLETVSTAAPRTPSTTTTVFNDEDVTMAMAQTLIKMKEEKAKEKGVVLKDVEDSSRPVRSITTLQPLPTIDPKDKDAEVALRLQAEFDKELKVERERQDEASKVAIAEMFNEVQERIDDDYELAARMTQEEQEMYTIKERARLLAEFIKGRKKQLAAERAEAIRNKPPTKTQLRNLMMTYLKNMGGYKHIQLKGKSYEEIHGLYERYQKMIQDFTPMDSEKEAQKPEEEEAEYGRRRKNFSCGKDGSKSKDLNDLSQVNSGKERDVTRRAKWDTDDYVCRGLILNGMSDPLFDIYKNVESVKLLWDFLEVKYMAEDASSSHLRIEESLRVQDSDKPKGNNVAGPSVVNMVEHNNSSRLNIVNDNIGSAFMSTSKLNDSILWHARLGHVHFKRMQDMSKDGLIPTFDMHAEKCKTCMLTRITKKPFQNVKRETEVLELIHSDLYDLYSTPSLGNKNYFVTFIDDASRAVVRLPDPKLKTLGERGIKCIFVGYAEHSKDFRFYVIEPNDSVLINSIIESRDALFDENRFSSVPRPSLRIPNGTEYIGGLMVPKDVIDEVAQQPEPELRKSKRNRTSKNFGPEVLIILN
ncbi:ribonuclease H-like domain-containing protein [Tanacetum coccineum]